MSEMIKKPHFLASPYDPCLVLSYCMRTFNQASDEDIRTRMRFIDKDKSGHITFEEFNDWLLMLPEISPRAFFDHFYRTGRADPLQDALCHNMPSSHGAKLANVAADLFSGAVAGVVSRTATAPIDRLRLLLQAAPPGTPSAGMAETVSKIIKEGGMKAFFRGNGVNCLKIAPEVRRGLHVSIFIFVLVKQVNRQEISM